MAGQIVRRLEQGGGGLARLLRGALHVLDAAASRRWCPSATCAALRAISRVALPCCSTAAAMASSPRSSARWCCRCCAAPPPPGRSPPGWRRPGRRSPRSPCAVWPASCFTSDATTAKPLPASPARAASIVAFSASRLVCPAMSPISRTTSPIRCAAWASPCTVAVGRPRLCRRVARHRGAVGHLAGDLGDARRQLLGAGRHGLDIGAGLAARPRPPPRPPARRSRRRRTAPRPPRSPGRRRRRPPPTTPPISTSKRSASLRLGGRHGPDEHRVHVVPCASWIAQTSRSTTSSPNRKRVWCGSRAGSAMTARWCAGRHGAGRRCSGPAAASTAQGSRCLDPPQQRAG